MSDNSVFFPMASEEIAPTMHDHWLEDQFLFEALPDDFELPSLSRLAGLDR